MRLRIIVYAAVTHNCAGKVGVSESSDTFTTSCPKSHFELRERKMAQSDHKTAESSESSEERGMLFVASQESAVITEPGNGALDDPSAAIAAQRPAILSQVLGPTGGAVRRDHFDAQ